MIAITAAWFALLEFGLRASGSRFPGSLYRPDATRFFRFRRNATAWMTIERDIFVRINNIGYHDKDRTLAKPPNVRRVAVLGDSNVAALYAPVELGLTESIAKGLPGFEVINFGAEGYGLAQDLVTLDNDAWAFHPAIVVLVVTPRTTIGKVCRS